MTEPMARGPCGDPPTVDEGERERVRQVYDRYRTDPYYKKIWSDSRATRFMLEGKWELLGRVLRAEGVDCRTSLVLDLGAGGGGDCARFRALGFQADHLVAFDLRESAAQQARQSFPWMASVQGDAGHLPFQKGCFQVAYQSTMLSSVLDAGRRQAILNEVRRILAPGGIFLSYDTRYRNYRNRNTRPVKSRELKAGFPGWSAKLWTVTGIPPLLRLLAPISITACRVVERVPVLRSHLLFLTRKP